MTCVFCNYSGEERHFRPVPTAKHHSDVICHLCDTKWGVENVTQPSRKRQSRNS